MFFLHMVGRIGCIESGGVFGRFMLYLLSGGMMTTSTESAKIQPQAHPWFFWLFSPLSGFLLMLSWPNVWVASFSFWPGLLAWISLVPFIYIWRRTGWRGAFVHAWVLGFVYFTGILSWITLINRDTNVSNFFTWMIFAFCGACYMALFGATTRFVSQRLKWLDTLVLPLGWVAWEYLRGHVLFGGWPWGSLGHTQYANPLVRQIAATAGVGGISFILVWFNVLVAHALERVVAAGGRFREAWRINWFWQPGVWKTLWRQSPVQGSLVAALSMLWAVLVVWCVVEAITFAGAPQKHFRVALIQGNTDTTQSWDRAYKTRLLERMERLHLQAVASQPALVIWAESCFPGILGYPDEREWEDRLRHLIKTGGVPTLLTSNEYVEEKNAAGDETYHHYNSSFLLGAGGEILGRYRKIKLVPFGEYIPWEILKRFLHAVVREPIPVDFEPGREYASLVFGDLHLSPLICYEDHFEELGFQLARRGARFFAGMANDRWAGTSAMSYQHTAMSTFLAIEHRVYLAKANMTGPTCMIDPWGNISRPLPYFQEGMQVVDVAYTPQYRTFFTQFGNVVVFSFLLLFAALLAAAWVIRK
jgi:apolipoprotein N-acyltransferase